jgi:proteasome assembly chaperone 3
MQIQASVPPTIPLTQASASNADSLPPVHPSIDLTYLFGHAPSSDHQALYSSYAAQVATLVWTSERYAQVGSSRTPVVVGVALKAPCSSERVSDADRATFLQIMDLVREIIGTVRAV